MALKLINNNVPRGSTEDPFSRYDEDGAKVKYTDAMYRSDLETDPRYKSSPFLVLYEYVHSDAAHASSAIIA